MNELVEPLAIAIRDRRAQLGLRLRDVADRMRLSISYVSDIEHGRRRISVVLAYRLAEALEAEPMKWVGWAAEDELRREGIHV